MMLHILAKQGDLMRFSSIFQIPLTQPLAARSAVPTRVEEPPVTQHAPVELPDDLDQRVRMIGEWQLGEG
jgi:hypothetical protein